MSAPLSLVHLAALGLAAAAATTACASLLGDDFVIGEAGGGGSSTATGGATSSGGAGGAGGAGGGETGPGPLSCSWGSVRMLASLEGELPDSNHYSGNQFQLVQADHQLRFWLQRRHPDGINRAELWTVEQGSERMFATEADKVQHAFALDGSRTAALLTLEGAGVFLVYAVVENTDGDGSGASMEIIDEIFGVIERYDAWGQPTGTGDAAVVQTYKLAGQSYKAAFLRTDAPNRVVFDDASADATLQSADYRLAALLREVDGDNHVILGSDFDGATRRRHFIVPDSVGSLLDPARDLAITPTAPHLLGMGRRLAEDFLVVYTQATNLEIRMGTVPGPELELHDPTAIPVVGSLPPADVPNGEAGFRLTEDQFVLVGGHLADLSGLRVMIMHRLSGLRVNQMLPYPDLGLFPPAYELVRVAILPENNLDTSLPGVVNVVWYVRSNTDDHHRLYFGTVRCVPVE